MNSVDRIVILYPGETSSARINKPANYSLSRLLILLHERGDVPITFLNTAKRYEKYGNIEFLHFSTINFLRTLLECRRRGGNTLIVNQMHGYWRYATVMRRLLPRSRLLVRLGGVYYGQEFINSARFDDLVRRELTYLRSADMILCTADGTPVDLYMDRVGVPRERYRKWLNGFPEIENSAGHRRSNQIVCISRLSAEKGLDYVIESFAVALPSLYEPHKLVFVGDGPETASLREQAERLQLGSFVEFVGHSDDVAKYLYTSKLMVAGLANNPVMEAIATATPVIAVELGEMRSLYGRFPDVHIVNYPPGGCGRIHPEHRAALVRDTAEKIVEVLNGRVASDARASARDRDLYRWEERLEDECDLYQSLFADLRA